MRIISALIILCCAAPANAQQSYLIDWDEAGEEAFVELVKYIWNVVIEVSASQ